MKSFRSISALFFAFLALGSSTNFVVGFHVCMGEIQNVALFGKAESCEMEKALPACHRHATAPCCEDETFFHEGDTFKASVEHFQIVAPTSADVELPLVLISEVIPGSLLSYTQYRNYAPPLRSCDRMVKYHAFLI